eukprot:13043719-Alexandrium_andersonii.AAC.1
MAWERCACNTFPRLTRATMGALRCRPRQLQSEDEVGEGPSTTRGWTTSSPCRRTSSRCRRPSSSTA